MSAKHSQLSFGKLLFALIGIVAVAFGAADVSSRAARAVFGENASFIAFAPAILSNQSLFATGRATTTPIVPTVLRIPSIGVRAQVEVVGNKADGSMGTPAKFDEVAWYGLGSKPGEPGNAVIAGHVNNALTTAGVFAHLTQVSVGDTIEVSNGSTTLTYVVKQIQTYPADEAPAASIFTREGPSQLVLITCDGEWIQSEKTFNKRLVIIATLH